MARFDVGVPFGASRVALAVVYESDAKYVAVSRTYSDPVEVRGESYVVSWTEWPPSTATQEFMARYTGHRRSFQQEE